VIDDKCVICNWSILLVRLNEEFDFCLISLFANRFEFSGAQDADFLASVFTKAGVPVKKQ
jgi:hypothetical protein